MADPQSPARATGEPAGGRRGDFFDYDRTVALSDGVFAIALTLLVLNIPQPSAGGDLWEKLGDLLPDLGAYALSFVVIASMWRLHHVFFRTLDRINGHLTSLNLAYLGLIALIPFPTGLLAARGEDAAAVIVYAVTIALVTGLGSAMSVYAQRAGLTEPRTESWLNYVFVPGVFLISIPIAVVSPTVALYSWLSLIVFGRVADRSERKRAAAAGSG